MIYFDRSTRTCCLQIGVLFVTTWISLTDRKSIYISASSPDIVDSFEEKSPLVYTPTACQVRLRPRQVSGGIHQLSNTRGL